MVLTSLACLRVSALTSWPVACWLLTPGRGLIEGPLSGTYKHPWGIKTSMCTVVPGGTQGSMEMVSALGKRPEKAKALPKQSSRTVAFAHDHVNNVHTLVMSSTIF